MQLALRTDNNLYVLNEHTVRNCLPKLDINKTEERLGSIPVIHVNDEDESFELLIDVVVNGIFCDSEALENIDIVEDLANKYGFTIPSQVLSDASAFDCEPEFERFDAIEL